MTRKCPSDDTKQAFPRGEKGAFWSHLIPPEKALMIRHQVYFDTLGSMQEDSASWCAVFAGLSVLRLVDAYTDTGSSIDPANWAQLHSVRAAIEQVGEGDTIRGALTCVLEEVT